MAEVHLAVENKSSPTLGPRPDAHGSHELSPPALLPFAAMTMTARDSFAESAIAFPEIPPALHDFLEDIGLIAVALSSDGEITYCNNALLEKTGLERREIIGAKWIDTFIPRSDKDKVQLEFARLLSGDDNPKKGSPFESGVVTRTGERRQIVWNNRALEQDGTVGGILCIGEDITARHAAELSLKQREHCFRSTFQEAPIAMGLVSLQGLWLQANTSFCELLGYSEGELTATNCLDITYPDDRTHCNDVCKRLLQREQKAFHYEKRYIHGNGHVVWALVDISLVDDINGDPMHFIVQVQNIGEQKQTEASLRASESFARSVVDGLREQVAILDTDGRVLSVNRAWRECQEKGAPLCADIAEGASYLKRCESESGSHAAVAREFASGVRGVLSGRTTEFTLEYAFHSEDKQQWFWGHATPFLESDGSGRQVQRVVVTHESITESKKAEESLRQSNAVLQATQEASVEGILLVDDRGVGVSFNKRFVELWNMDSDKVEEMRANQELLAFVLDSLKDPDEFIQRINFLYDHPHASTRDEIYLKDGRVFDRYSAPALSPQGHSYGRVWSFSDITVRKTNEERLAHQAFHDVLTELPNRALFLDRLERAISRAKRHHQYPAVLFLDLDRFKLINDSLGHEAGDQLLVAVASRLRDCLRPEDTAARLGGDEFTILLEYITGVEDAIRIAERIAEELRSPFVIGKHEVFTTTSIGIALNGDETEHAEDLMRNADAAMYLAKSRGKAHYEVFDPNMTVRTLEHLELENDLRRALKRGEFYLVYQPIVDLASGRVVGAEALVRWQHPRRGVVLPNEFIPLAEETSLILQLGQWVLRQACMQACAWAEMYPASASYSISINLSARQFGQSHLIEEVADVLQETGIDPHRVVFEITESVIMEDAESTVGTLLALKKLGVQLAIDDFGTGYSSLSYLKRFPVNTLKVDRSFVAGLGSDSEDTAIVRAVITLAKTLGIAVVAEGIETPAHSQHLRDLQCELGQGYFFSRPLTATQFFSIVSEKQALP